MVYKGGELIREETNTVRHDDWGKPAVRSCYFMVKPVEIKGNKGDVSIYWLT